MTFVTVPASIAQIKAGRLRALGVTDPKRIAALPDTPTIAESGVPGFKAYFWHGIIVPHGTPREIIAKLNAEINRVLLNQDVKERLAGMGEEVVASTPQELTDFIKAEIELWGKIITPDMRLQNSEDR